jgi:adenylate cyclase
VRRWAPFLALPVVVFVVLHTWSELNPRWLDRTAHFWLVLAVALVSVALALAASEAARRNSDARLFLVSLAFLASAGFLGLHALATPGIVQDTPNAGFDIASQTGLLLAVVLAAVSALDLSPSVAQAVIARQRLLRGGLLALFVLWGVVVIAELPPLDRPFPDATGNDEDPLASPFILIPGAIGTACAAFAAFRYYGLYRRRPTPALLGTTIAFVLLLETMPVIALADVWHVSWWEWHVLLVLAYGTVAASVRHEYRRGRSLTKAFEGFYLDLTLDRLDQRHGTALEELVGALKNEAPITPVLERLREQFSADELTMLEQSAREVHRIDETFRPYVSPQLAERLEREPELAALGGEEREVSILFADLEGFTSYSEGHSPTEVIAMLNEYWGIAVPVVVEERGLIDRFAGDAVLVIFNADGDQPDHARRAAVAALRLQERCTELARRRPGWPRLRAGVNTGTAVVGHVGAAQQRSFTAIGDTTNVASRLQSAAPPGEVVIAATTRAQLGEADVERLPPLDAKGKSEPLEAYLLRGLPR